MWEREDDRVKQHWGFESGNAEDGSNRAAFVYTHMCREEMRDARQDQERYTQRYCTNHRLERQQRRSDLGRMWLD